MTQESFYRSNPLGRTIDAFTDVTKAGRLLGAALNTPSHQARTEAADLEAAMRRRQAEMQAEEQRRSQIRWDQSQEDRKARLADEETMRGRRDVQWRQSQEDRKARMADEASRQERQRVLDERQDTLWRQSQDDYASRALERENAAMKARLDSDRLYGEKASREVMRAMNANPAFASMSPEFRKMFLESPQARNLAEVFAMTERVYDDLRDGKVDDLQYLRELVRQHGGDVSETDQPGRFEFVGPDGNAMVLDANTGEGVSELIQGVRRQADQALAVFQQYNPGNTAGDPVRSARASMFRSAMAHIGDANRTEEYISAFMKDATMQEKWFLAAAEFVRQVEEGGVTPEERQQVMQLLGSPQMLNSVGYRMVPTPDGGAMFQNVDRPSEKLTQQEFMQLVKRQDVLGQRWRMQLRQWSQQERAAKAQADLKQRQELARTISAEMGARESTAKAMLAEQDAQAKEQERIQAERERLRQQALTDQYGENAAMDRYREAFGQVDAQLQDSAVRMGVLKLVRGEDGGLNAVPQDTSLEKLRQMANLEDGAFDQAKLPNGTRRPWREMHEKAKAICDLYEALLASREDAIENEAKTLRDTDRMDSRQTPILFRRPGDPLPPERDRPMEDYRSKAAKAALERLEAARKAAEGKGWNVSRGRNAFADAERKSRPFRGSSK
ncbi:MAG: hypothetical protein ACI4WT_03095 [Oligosphaeraceae bacterium]